MNQDRNDRKVSKIAVFIVSIVVIFFSISYAFINQTLTGTKKQVITAGNLELALQEEDALTLENALPMYDEVGMIQKSYDFTLVNKTSENTKYTLKLKDVTGENIQKLDTSFVKYGLTKDGVQVIDSLSNLENMIIDEGTLYGEQTIHYMLRLWIDSDVEDELLIKDKVLSYKLEVEGALDMSVAASKQFFTETALGDNCKTYDDGVDTFLVGQCSKNYVWYSGKLWRAVLKNDETGAVKMVTDNAITTIPYNELNNPVFENSYMDQWLNQEFLPTLHDYKDYLVEDSVWDATEYSSNYPEQRPSGTLITSRAVGLLNMYEYHTTYNKSGGLATYSNGYLNNGTAWWSITRSYPEIRIVSTNGDIYSSRVPVSNGYGVRPAIHLKSNVHIISGDGTIGNPYWLEGDKQKTVNRTTLLATRYSGEYIEFNNELYRIVGTEALGQEKFTKVTAVDKPAELVSTVFDSSNSHITNFGQASIKTDLETYYQNNIEEPYQSMIVSNTTWYLGTVGEGANYKLSICETADSAINVSTCVRTANHTTATVGLPRVGEMFTSQITRGTKAIFWTLTPYIDRFNSVSGVRTVDQFGNLGYNDNMRTASFGVRPSMYLKPNVVIASTNTGDGTYEHPYTIELSQ